MRSKSAKIILWVLLGLTAAALLSMLIIFVIDANGGTGTTHHWAMPLFSSIFAVFGILLLLTYMLTEPSFKKKPEDEEELYTVDRTSYVKKAKQPRPITSTATAPEEAPIEEAPAEEAPAEEAPAEEAPAEEAPAEEAPVEEATAEEAPVEEAPVEEATAEEAPVEEAKDAE